MRNMEQIEESELEDDGSASRKLATLLMAALVTVGLVLAMGILLGRTADAVDHDLEDPLAALDELSAHAIEVSEEPELPELNREDLTFPEVLGNFERRPEVVAAIAAAAAELEHPEPLLQAPPTLPQAAVDTAPLPSSLPAAVAAGPGSVNLARIRQSDALVLEALPPEPPQTPVAAGHDGPFTLQVASFQNPSDANDFADELRARSHSAFVTTTEIPDRGTFWRVRIGPFENMREVSSYRSTFEAEEQMNSYIVRRRD